MRRWLNRPQNLQRVFIGQLGFVGLGALEGSRRLLNGDYQWYTGFRGDKSNERPNTVVDDWFDNLFTKFGTSGDSFVTPEQAKPGQKRLRDGGARKRLDISPADNKRKRDPPVDPSSVKRPRVAPEVSLAMPDASTETNNHTGTGKENGLKPYGATSNYLPDYFTFRGTSTIWKKFDGTARGDSGAPANAVNSSQSIRIRLNSPADINLTTTGSNDSNAPLKGFSHWKTTYSHYRVIKTEVKIYFNRRRWELAKPSGTTAAETVAHYYDDTPYMVGFVCDPSGRLGTNLDSKSFHAILKGKHVAHKYLIGGQQTGFSYTYVPESWDMSLPVQQRDQFWTPVSTNPTSSDIMIIYVAPVDLNATAAIDCIVEVEMTVQMRELNDSILAGLYTVDSLIATADVTTTTEDMEEL